MKGKTCPSEGACVSTICVRDAKMDLARATYKTIISILMNVINEVLF